jgi:hypothetical protein
MLKHPSLRRLSSPAEGGNPLRRIMGLAVLHQNSSTCAIFGYLDAWSEASPLASF